MAKKVDYQREKVYAFERETKLYDPATITFADRSLENWMFHTIEEAQIFTSAVLREYRVMRDVKVRYIKGRIRGSAYADVEIRIGDQYKSPRYLMHEIAHIILHNRFPYGASRSTRTDQSGNENRHGPQFVALLMELRHRYFGDDLAWMKGVAYKHRIIAADENGELQALLARKQEALANGWTDEAKKIRRQIRALNAKNLKEAAGSQVQARRPVVRQKRVYSVECKECGKKWQSWPTKEYCSKCGSTDLDWVE